MKNDVGRFHIDKAIENFFDLGPIQTAIEKFDLFFLVLQEVRHLQAVDDACLSRRPIPPET